MNGKKAIGGKTKKWRGRKDKDGDKEVLESHSGKFFHFHDYTFNLQS